MGDSRKKWEEMREEGRQGTHKQLKVHKMSVEQRMDELEKRISEQTELLEEILKNFG